MRKTTKGTLRLAVVMSLLVLAGCSCEHEYGEYEVQTPATCTAAGEEVRVCTKCNEKESREVPVLEHSYGEWEVTKEPTCVEQGEKTKTCSGCNDTKVEKTKIVQHSYGDWKITKAATCTEQGEKAMACSVCGDTKTEKTELAQHTYGAWSTVTAATCTSNGQRTRSCSGCGAQESGTISATGHNYKASTVSALTCTTVGVTKHTCASCGHSYQDTTAAPGHKWENATCTKAKTCSACGQTEGSALGHSSGSDGKCTRCGVKVTIDMKTRISAPTEEFASLRGMNSAGLIKLVWTADNNSGKTIKYYSVTVYYYNAVDDPAENDITGKTSYTVKYVGPVKPGESLLVSEAGYCSIASKVVVGDITLEYMDGTTETGWYGYYFYI